jgi:hypothetical protein
MDTEHVDKVRSDAKHGTTTENGKTSQARVPPTVHGLPVPAHAAGA